MYMCTYICSQKLSEQISCGFKILVKLGVRMQKFKITLVDDVYFVILKVNPRYCFAGCIREYPAWNNFHSKQNPFLCLVSAFLYLFLSPFQTISFNNSFQFVYM